MFFQFVKKLLPKSAYDGEVDEAIRTAFLQPSLIIIANEYSETNFKRADNLLSDEHIGGTSSLLIDYSVETLPTKPHEQFSTGKYFEATLHGNQIRTHSD